MTSLPHETFEKSESPTLMNNYYQINLSKEQPFTLIH